MKRAVLLALLVACSPCNDDPTEETMTEPPTEVEEPEPVAQPVEDERPERPGPPSAETWAQARQAIAEGRGKAAADDFEGALAAFDRALELVPSAARVRCEAGFLAHRAGQHARAAREIDLALLSMPQGESVPDAWKVPVAMCLYNRGLVGEAMDAEGDDDEWDALERYQESLELRENATVRTRMNALEARLGEETTPAAGSLQDVIQTIGDVCEYETNCREANYRSSVQDESDERPCWEQRVERNEELGDARAVALEVASTECISDVYTQYLALEGQEEWTAFELGSNETANTDSFYREESDGSSEVELTRIDDTLVRVDYTNFGESHYGGDDERDGEHCYVDNYTRSVTHKLLLCRQDRPHALCGTVVLGSASGTSWESSCGGGEPFPPGLEDVDASIARRIRFEDGAVIVEATDSAPPGYEGPDPGRYTLDAFFAEVLTPMRPASTD